MRGLLPVFFWRDAHKTGKDPGEIVLVMKGQFVGDLLDGLLRECQLLAGILDLQLVEVLNGREAGALPEDSGEVGNR